MGMNTAAVQRLYVAYFNRPADPVSLSVYEGMLPTDRVASQAELLVLAEQYFSPSAEYTSNFAGMSNAQIVDQLYTNIFGRTAEASGLISWATELTNGNITVAQLALQLSYSAQGTDAAVVDARIEAATSFTSGLTTADQITGYSGDAAAAQLGHLVLHQGDQWRNHKHHPTAHQGRQLITKRLPRPRRQNSQAITALQQGLNHLALTGTKVAVTEVLLQRLQQRCTGILHPRTVPATPWGARPQATCCSGGASS